MDLGDRIRGGSFGSAAGRGFRRQFGVLYAASGLNEEGFARDARGRFITFQSVLRDRNERMAEELQLLMAFKLEESRVPSRRGVASGRLEAALLDPRNRTATTFGFGVGKISWLDKSEAKYWRSIEVGTSQFVGNQLPVGLWGASLTGEYGGSSRFGPYPLAGGPFSPTGGRRSDRMRPMGKSFAYRHLIESGMRRRDAFLASRRRGIITQPIEAHHYMRDAWRDFHVPAQAIASMEAALAAAGLGGRRSLR